MKAIRLLVLSGLLLATLPVCAREVPATWQTRGDLNGRFWKDLDRNSRIFFVSGYMAAVDRVTLVMTPDLEHYTQAYKAFLPRTLTVAEISSMLDRFYDAPENGPIPVASAMFIISQRAEGVDEPELEKQIRQLRAVSSQ